MNKNTTLCYCSILKRLKQIARDISQRFYYPMSFRKSKREREKERGTLIGM